MDASSPDVTTSGARHMTATRLEDPRSNYFLFPSSSTTTMPTQQRRNPPPQQSGALLANVVAKALSVGLVLGLSLTVSAYRRSLTPLYGTAPVEQHLNKISWLACAVGSLLPLMPLQYAVLALGVLLCAMPNSSYWVAAYTGRLHEPMWGPVLTHLLVFTPVLALGVLIVRILQVSHACCSPKHLLTTLS